MLQQGVNEDGIESLVRKVKIVGTADLELDVCYSALGSMGLCTLYLYRFYVYGHDLAGGNGLSQPNGYGAGTASAVQQVDAGPEVRDEERRALSGSFSGEILIDASTVSMGKRFSPHWIGVKSPLFLYCHEPPVTLLPKQ